MSPTPPCVLAEDDYYRYSRHFKKWLLTRHHVYFDTLTSEKARKHFKTFVEKWNDGRVSDEIYNLDPNARVSSSNSSYAWFKNKTGADEDRERNESEFKPSKQHQHDQHEQQQNKRYEQHDRNDRQRRRDHGDLSPRSQRKSDKVFQKRKREDLDELVPKPEPGTAAARREKRLAKSGKANGDNSPEYRDDFLMGKDSDINQLIRKRKEKRESDQRQKQEAASERLKELQDKENARMEQFKKMVGFPERFSSADKE